VVEYLLSVYTILRSVTALSSSDIERYAFWTVDVNNSCWTSHADITSNLNNKNRSQLVHSERTLLLWAIILSACFVIRGR